MTESEFQQLVELGHEARGVEYKSPGRRDDGAFLAEVARAAMGMANHRDGGTIVLGILERDKTPVFEGMSEDAIATWNYDDTAAALSSLSLPSLSLNVEVVPYSS